MPVSASPAPPEAIPGFPVGLMDTVTIRLGNNSPCTFQNNIDSILLSKLPGNPDTVILNFLRNRRKSRAARWVPLDADAERTFAFDEARKEPARCISAFESFLLVFRITRHVVTIVNVQSDVTMSSAGCPGFPAYGQMRTAPLPVRGATNCCGHCTCPLQPCHLRTVIVTAAVYRGLVSKLRPKTNLST